MYSYIAKQSSVSCCCLAPKRNHTQPRDYFLLIIALLSQNSSSFSTLRLFHFSLIFIACESSKNQRSHNGKADTQVFLHYENRQLAGFSNSSSYIITLCGEKKKRREPTRKKLEEMENVLIEKEQFFGFWL